MWKKLIFAPDVIDFAAHHFETWGIVCHGFLVQSWPFDGFQEDMFHLTAERLYQSPNPLC